MKVAIFFAIIGTALALPTGPDVIKFAQTSEWSLVPDSDYRLRMVHSSEIQNVPESRFDAEAEVNFNLFTRSNTASVNIPIFNTAALSASNFNPSHPTRFLIHGWNSGPGDFLNTALPGIFLDHSDYNIFFVDWSAGAVNPNYITARRNVDELGPVISRYVEWLVENGSSLSSVNIIGHSLGGHAAGLGGKFVSIGRVHAVIALDPAGPLFSLDEPLRRVAPGDADYVEVIHTNGNLLGFGDPIGDADFYPNGGNSQPGCGADTAGGCSHGRAVLFFAESINSQTGFWSDRCASFAEIGTGSCTPQGDRAAMGGEPANNGIASGVYFLETESQSPFALG